MYLFEIDSAHNRMNIMLADVFTEAEARELLEKCREHLAEIRPNCRILCNLLSLKSFDCGAREIYRKLMDLCNAAGARIVVRIVASPVETFGLNIMSAFHYAHGVDIRTTDSFTKALKLLE